MTETVVWYTWMDEQWGRLETAAFTSTVGAVSSSASESPAVLSRAMRWIDGAQWLGEWAATLPSPALPEAASLAPSLQRLFVAMHTFVMNNVHPTAGLEVYKGKGKPLPAWCTAWGKALSSDSVAAVVTPLLLRVLRTAYLPLGWRTMGAAMALLEASGIWPWIPEAEQRLVQAIDALFTGRAVDLLQWESLYAAAASGWFASSVEYVWPAWSAAHGRIAQAALQEPVAEASFAARLAEAAEAHALSEQWRPVCPPEVAAQLAARWHAQWNDRPGAHFVWKACTSFWLSRDKAVLPKKTEVVSPLRDQQVLSQPPFRDQQMLSPLREQGVRQELASLELYSACLQAESHVLALSQSHVRTHSQSQEQSHSQSHVRNTTAPAPDKDPLVAQTHTESQYEEEMEALSSLLILLAITLGLFIVLGISVGVLLYKRTNETMQMQKETVSNDTQDLAA